MNQMDPRPSPRARWLGLFAASLGLFACTLDITVNVALPAITRSFATDAATIQWIIIAYIGCTTGLQLSLGSAADSYGLRRFYLAGIAVYAAAVLAIGLGPGLDALLGFRVVQAVGNGLILAAAPALVTGLFPESERGRALGAMTGISTLGLVAGSLAGGLLVDTLGWPWIFLVRVPLCVLAFALAAAVLKMPAADPSSRQGFDLAGAATLFVALTSLIGLLSLGGRIGWDSVWIPALAGTSSIAFVAFARVESRAANPILHFELLANRVLAAASVSGFALFMASFVNFFVLPYYLTDVLGRDAVLLGGVLAANAVAGTLGAPAGGWLADRASAPVVATVSLLATAAALAWFTTLDATTTMTGVTLRMVAIGACFGAFQAANATIVMSAVPPDRLGTGAAIMALSRGLGSATSVAIMGSMFSILADGQNSADGFMTSFRNIYWLAAALAIAGTAVSVLCWRPRRV